MTYTWLKAMDAKLRFYVKWYALPKQKMLPFIMAALKTFPLYVPMSSRRGHALHWKNYFHLPKNKFHMERFVSFLKEKIILKRWRRRRHDGISNIMLSQA